MPSYKKAYTPRDLLNLADKLVSQGYVRRQGKPTPGDKSLLAELMARTGASRSTVIRVLDGKTGPLRDKDNQKVKVLFVEGKSAPTFDDEDTLVIGLPKKLYEYLLAEGISSTRVVRKEK